MERPLSGTNQRPPTVSLVLPAFNEQETIARAIAEAEEALEGLGCTYEILVVDDGSTDRTLSIAEQAAGPSVRVLSQPENLGYGAALRAGFAAARGDLVGFTDADCQFDLRQIDRLILLCRDHDAACGYRIDRQDPPHRRFLAAVYNAIVRRFFRLKIRDCDCAFKLFRREALRQVELTSDGFFVNAELLAKLHRAGASIVEVGVTHRPRLAGQSTVSVGHALPVLREIARFWWNWELFPARDLATSAERSGGSRQTWRRFATLLALITPLLALYLSYPLLDPDETRYARIPAEMLSSGDFLVPTLEGEPYLDKPPLLYWVTAGFYRILGSGDRFARLSSVLAALVTAGAGFWIGRRLFGERAAWLGTIAFSITLGLLAAGRFLSTDALLVATVTTGFLAALLGVGGDRYRPGWWALAGVACGLGVLTKGPVALVLCLPPLLAGRWLSGSRVRLTALRWVTFGLPLVVLAGPWFVLMSWSRPGFLSYFFVRHHLQRFVQGFDHSQPWWFYLPILLVLLLPVTAALPALFAQLVSRHSAVRAVRSREDGYLLLFALWIVVFFSSSSSKLPSYVLPALPAIGLLVGRMIDQFAWGASAAPAVSRRAPRLAMACGLFFAVLLGLIDIALDGEPRIMGHLFAAGLITASLLVAVSGFFERLQDGRRRWLAVTAVFWACWAMLFFDLFPEAAYLRALPQRARVAAVTSGDRALPIIAVGWRPGPGLLYMRRDEIEDLAPTNVESIRRWLELSPRLLLIGDRRIAGGVAQLVPERTLRELDDKGHLFLIEQSGTAAARRGGHRSSPAP